MSEGMGRRAPIVGIDLGTTNSCVAVVGANGARVLRSPLGYTTIPSVVALDAEGRIVVGQRARQQMLLNPANTVYGSKRLVGRPFVSPTVQACRDRFHYEIVPAEGGAAAVRIGGRVLSLQEVAAAILSELREMGSQALGQPIRRAAITVPAHYNDHQRQAVREAGRLAGLRVERIVNEPTAAAVAFGFGKGVRKRVLVYDLGGGTFDASVVEVDGDIYEVVSTGGDTFLGGVDFDNALVDFLLERFRAAHGFDPPSDLTVRQRVVDAAEQAKVELSGRESSAVRVPQLCASPAGASVDIEATVTRADLEGLTRHLVDRTIEVCHDVLRARGLGRGDLDEVLLVGGQSRMPLVWRRIQEEFGKDPSRSVHPDEAVAIGAAVLADADARIDSVVLLDALAIGIGVALPGGRMVSVLPRNTRLPAKRTYEVTAAPDAAVVELAVFQGESAQASECEYLGTARIRDVPHAANGGTTVAVEFALGNEGTLSLRARDVASGRALPVEFTTVETPEALRVKLQLPAAPIAPRGARPIVGHGGRGANGIAGTNGAAHHAPEPGAGAPLPDDESHRKGLLARLFGRS